MNWWNSKEQGSALMYILMMIKEIEFNIRCELHLVRECCVNLRISLILKSSIIQEHLRGISARNTEDPSSTLQSFCSKTEVKPHTLLSFFLWVCFSYGVNEVYMCTWRGWKAGLIFAYSWGFVADLGSDWVWNMKGSQFYRNGSIS